tara:strand:+ start:871 stop:1104 length:234 start_codon:yes stop_codon:yes gene_type:complete
MKINEVVDESIETKLGLTKDQKDAIGGRGKYKPKKPASPVDKRNTARHQDFTTRAPVNYNQPITMKDPAGAMRRSMG